MKRRSFLSLLPVAAALTAMRPTQAAKPVVVNHPPPAVAAYDADDDIIRIMARACAEREEEIILGTLRNWPANRL